MQTTPVTYDQLAASVIAVPPLCRKGDDSLDAAENTRLIQHIEAGGVTTLLYGGNANFYNIAVSEYAEILEMLEARTGDATLVIPSVGPSYGTMMDQAAILAGSTFPTVMVLPTTAVATVPGIQTAIRRFVDKSGIKVVLYMKEENYLTAEAAKELVDDGIVSWIKYAVVREDPAKDALLADLANQVDPAMIVSGIGEQPAPAHLNGFGIGGFTSGCVCVAPAKSMSMLRALKAGDLAAADSIRQEFEDLESLRNAHGPIPVLHHAVALAGIAETGPHLPLQTELPQTLLTEISNAALALRE